MPEFYVEGHTVEGAPYGPVHVLTVPLEEGWEEAWRESEQPKGANAVVRAFSPSAPS